MTQPGTETGQRSTGRPIIQHIGGIGNFMAWTGTTPNNWLNLDFQATGFVFGATYSEADSSNCGPALVLNPTCDSASLFWTNTSGNICWTLASPNSPGSSDWTIAAGAPEIPDATATTGPAACLSMAGSQLAVTVVWQDTKLGSMAIWQRDVWGDTTATPVTPLAASCIDSPTLLSVTAGTFLAYFDTSRNFNLAFAPGTGIAFDFANCFTTTAINSAYAPALVMVSPRIAYVIWSTTDSVAYQMICTDSQGQWQINGNAGCSGSITNVTPCGGPCADLIPVEIDGVMTKQILIAWPESNYEPTGMVFTTTVTPNTDLATIDPTLYATVQASLQSSVTA